MGILGTLITVIIVGLIAGFIARAVVPGRQSMGIGATIVLGIIGSFIGGFLGFVIFPHHPPPSCSLHWARTWAAT